jgi:hypothetical protein
MPWIKVSGKDVIPCRVCGQPLRERYRSPKTGKLATDCKADSAAKFARYRVTRKQRATEPEAPKKATEKAKEATPRSKRSRKAKQPAAA